LPVLQWDEGTDVQYASY